MTNETLRIRYSKDGETTIKSVSGNFATEVFKLMELRDRGEIDSYGISRQHYDD